MILLNILIFLAGLLLVGYTLASAARTVVIPRAERVPMSRWVFELSWTVFDLFARRTRTYEQRDRVMALYAPFGLLLLPIEWVIFVTLGYTAMFWATGTRPLLAAFTTSGSAVLTLGSAELDSLPHILLTFSEATLGLGLVALLIAYLPTIYGAFSGRETAVAMLEIRAGSPPSPVTMLARAQRLNRLDKLTELWESWEVWFAEVEESHTSLAALVFFRSPQPDRSWLTAAGVIMDSAALLRSVVDVPRDVQADICIRAGYVALRRIADFFRIAYDPDPERGDPISISRDEFDEVCHELEEAGVPLKTDRNEAWLDFAGWRVNYDTIILRLAALIEAPYAMWISDRSPVYDQPTQPRKK